MTLKPWWTVYDTVNAIRTRHKNYVRGIPCHRLLPVPALDSKTVRYFYRQLVREVGQAALPPLDLVLEELKLPLLPGLRKVRTTADVVTRIRVLHAAWCHMQPGPMQRPYPRPNKTAIVLYYDRVCKEWGAPMPELEVVMLGLRGPKTIEGELA